MTKTFPELKEHQERIEKALSSAKPEQVLQGKAILSANCESYIEAQGFDAKKLLETVASSFKAGRTISYKVLYESCHREGGKWGVDFGMAAARFCTGAVSIWGWANNLPGMNDVVVNGTTGERGEGATTMDYLKR